MWFPNFMKFYFIYVCKTKIYNRKIKVLKKLKLIFQKDLKSFRKILFIFSLVKIFTYRHKIFK